MNVEQTSWRNLPKVETKTRNKLKEMINDLNNIWNYPYWVEVLQNYLTDELKVMYLAYEWYYEKRCSSRSYSIDIDKINLLRIIFWIKFADIIDN